MPTLRASSIALGLALASCVAGCTSTEQLLQASNDRDWEPLYAVLPTADVQGDLAKYQGQLEENSSEAQDRTGTQADVQRTVDALKRKMDSIR